MTLKITKIKIKKGDTVLINTGKGLGKRGKIEQVFPKNNKVTVTGVNIIKKHLKPSRKNPHGGIIDKIAPIDASNVTVVCPRCSLPTRIGYRFADNSAKGGSASGRKKMRICKKCKESIDA
jgi:large subunit ribosomal protein L24